MDKNLSANPSSKEAEEALLSRASNISNENLIGPITSDMSSDERRKALRALRDKARTK